MMYQCALDVNRYPNCNALGHMIRGWISPAGGELEIAASGTPPGKVSLIFRPPLSKQKTSLYSWSLDEKYFKAPGLLCELLELTTRFVTMAAEESNLRIPAHHVQRWPASAGEKRVAAAAGLPAAVSN
jgi:hypothetical protein